MNGLAEKESLTVLTLRYRTHPIMLFWYIAKISPNQTHDLKPTDSRKWKEDQGEGITHKHSQQKRQTQELFDLELAPVSPPSWSWDEYVWIRTWCDHVLTPSR
jgi:hypothetical protein